MEVEECDICGRKCDGTHRVRANNKEIEIQKMVNVLWSYDEATVDEIIRRIYEKRNVKK